MFGNKRFESEIKMELINLKGKVEELKDKVKYLKEEVFLLRNKPDFRRGDVAYTKNDYKKVTITDVMLYPHFGNPFGRSSFWMALHKEKIREDYVIGDVNYSGYATLTDDLLTEAQYNELKSKICKAE